MSFLSESEQMKGALIAKKLQTLGWGCSGSGIICLYSRLENLYIPRPRASLKYNSWQ